MQSSAEKKIKQQQLTIEFLQNTERPSFFSRERRSPTLSFSLSLLFLLKPKEMSLQISINKLSTFEGSFKKSTCEIYSLTYFILQPTKIFNVFFYLKKINFRINFHFVSQECHLENREKFNKRNNKPNAFFINNNQL